jgi:hypothetical protein
MRCTKRTTIDKRERRQRIACLAGRQVPPPTAAHLRQPRWAQRPWAHLIDVFHKGVFELLDLAENEVSRCPEYVARVRNVREMATAVFEGVPPSAFDPEDLMVTLGICHGMLETDFTGARWRLLAFDLTSPATLAHYHQAADFVRAQTKQFS